MENKLSIRRFIVVDAADTKDAFVNLAAAVVKQAMRDYRRALIRDDKHEIAHLKEWFLSDYGQMLSSGNGEYIAEQVEKSVRFKRIKA